MTDIRRQVIYSASTPDVAQLGQLWIDTSTSPPRVQLNNSSTGLSFVGLGPTSLDLTANYTWTGLHTFNGKVVVGTPASGVALTVNLLAGQYGVDIAGDGSSQYMLRLNSSGVTSGRTAILFNTGGVVTQQWALGSDTSGGSSGTFILRNITGATLPLQVTTAGNLTLASPSSSFHTVNTFTDNRLGIKITDGVNYTGSLGRSTDFTNAFWIGAEAGNTLVLGAGARSAIDIGTSGNVSILAPASGTALAVAGTASATNLTVTGSTKPANGVYLPAANTLGFATNSVLQAFLDANGVFYDMQPTPTAINATATATIAQLLTLIITSTSAAATSITLPTGTLSDAGILGGASAANTCFDWSIINTGPNTVTVLAGVGHTLVGAATTATLTSSRWRTRKTAANTFVTYRLSV